MHNNDSNVLVTVENTIAPASAFAGLVDAHLCPFNQSDPMEESRRSVSILKQVGGVTVAKQHDLRSPMATHDDAHTTIPGVNSTVSHDGGIGNCRRANIFAMGSDADLSITRTSGALDIAERAMPQLPATLALLPVGSPGACVTHP